MVSHTNPMSIGHGVFSSASHFRSGERHITVPVYSRTTRPFPSLWRFDCVRPTLPTPARHGAPAERPLGRGAVALPRSLRRSVDDPWIVAGDRDLHPGHC